ncbi:MAG: Smr/MutS family protein, partial [Candidatus Spyradocola sp.]|nr:Smr/MutS family protein [Candidatus Spyradocola sp.]
TLRPTYRLSIGVPGKSNAFEISRKLGLPEEIIDSAKEKLSGDQVRFEDVIANAEYHRQIAEKERKLAEEAHLETQRLRDEAEKLRSDLAAHRERDLRKAKDEARRILQRAQRESEQLIADLKKKNSGELKEHELHAMRAKLQSAIDENAEKIEVPAGVGEVPKTVQVGDTVELTNLGTKATILTLPDSKGECTVQAGALKLKAKLKDMRTAQPDKPKKQPKSGNRIHVAPRPVETECDVRGCNLEEALMAVDLFLDGAVLNRLRSVSIIHGKGTGILRAGIHKHLRTHAAVKEFRLGRYGEGEDGVTIVTLK